MPDNSADSASIVNPALDTYVWETMKESLSTFETTAGVLTAVRRFYGSVDEMPDRAKRRELRSEPSAVRLSDASTTVKETTSPVIAARRSTPKDRLAAADIDID